MLSLQFGGWFQCRLATDPDPTDEPRGASGFTFALAGEPDFDRILRLHDPVAPRSHGPAVGVFVSAVMAGGEPAPEHPLAGGRVALRGEPRIESRNYIVADGSRGLIEPFELAVEGGGVTLSRRDLLYPDQPEAKLFEVPPALIERRCAVGRMLPDPARVAAATGIADPLAYRRRRRDLLRADLDRTDDEVTRAALEKRIAELAITSPAKLQVWTMGAFQSYRFDLNGPAELTDPDRRLDLETIDFEQDWPLSFWLGGWDADALCGYISGLLELPQPNGRRDASKRGG